MSIGKEMLRYKCLGALIGTFVGDALGMPFEGWHFKAIERRYGKINRMYNARLGKGTYTDDTQMMIAVAESLVENKGFNGKDMASKFLLNYDPRRGYGQGTVRSLSLLRSGVDWQEAGKRVFKGGSFGNGSAMRVAPVGIFYAQNTMKLKEVAYKSSQITHAHSLGKEGAALQASAVAEAFLRSPQDKLHPEDFLANLIRKIPREAVIFHQKLNIIGHLLKEKPSKDEVVEKLGIDSRAFQSIPSAIYCFLANSESFEESLVYAVGLGGDADTIGAMTGAIAGAYHSLSNIPVQWIDELENHYKGKDYVMELGNKIFDLVYK